MAGVEIIRTERRRRYSAAEKAALLAEVDRGGCSVAAVARRHGMSESVLYNWRSHQRAAASIASEPLQFIAYGEVTDVAPPPAAPVISSPPVPMPRSPASPEPRQQTAPSVPAHEEFVRPHPGPTPGGIEIALPTGVRLSVDSYVNEKALARVLRALHDVPCSR